MQHSTNFNMNKPELNEQYRLSHWNENTDIIDTELKALQVISDATFKTALLNFCYPIGSLYWSSKSTDPAQLFGGTWTRIKNEFIWAKGDNDTVNSTGGSKTVTLTVANLPPHNHSFTPSGTVSSHSHGLNNHTHSFTPSGTIKVTTDPTFKGSAVTSGANSRGHTHGYQHTHNFTPSGKIASISGGTDNKTSGMSANSTVYFRSANSADEVRRPITDVFVNLINPTYSYDSDGLHCYHYTKYNGKTPSVDINSNSTWNAAIQGKEAYIGGWRFNLSLAHTHTAYFTGTTGTTTSQSTATSGAESQNHTHSVTADGTISGGVYSFTGPAGTTGGSTGNTTSVQPTFTGTAGVTGKTGSGESVDKMPPYIVKYCWERTA